METSKNNSFGSANSGGKSSTMGAATAVNYGHGKTSQTTSGGASKLKRAFSLSRNPFHSVGSGKGGDHNEIRKSGTNSAMTNGGGVTSEQNSINSGGGNGSGGGLGVGDGDGGGYGNGPERGKLQPGGGSTANTAVSEVEAKNNLHNNQQQQTQNAERKIFRRLSVKKFINRIAQQMNYVNLTGNQKSAAASRDRLTGPAGVNGGTGQPTNGFVWPPDTVPGVIGLRNHGNTCFMNAVLQCLSHTDILAEYFVLDQYKADLKRRNKINAKKFGTKGELTEQLALVLKSLWTCKDAPEYSSSFKAVVDRYGSQFRSSTQHDAQEFLFWLLDKVHEDLNTATKRKYKTIKNNYGRSDEVIAAETLANHIRCNNSFVQAVFQAQFRSSLTCPRCHKQSNTFDPFHCISVQLPQLTQQPVFVRVLYASQQPKQVQLGLGIPNGSSVSVLREQLHADTGISVDRMILAEIGEAGFSRVYCDSHMVSSVGDDGQVYCIESPKPATEGITQIVLCISNARRDVGSGEVRRFGTPFCIMVSRDVSYVELQKLLLKEMSSILKSEVFAFSTPLQDMFKMRLQDPSCDADAFLEATVEHPLFTEMIDLALSVLPTDAGPAHVKLLIEWTNPERFFSDMTDPFVEHESVSQMKEKIPASNSLTLEQCLEHYTKAETLSAEDAWRCPHCQKYLPVVKTLGLWSLPNIMVIHFKRFRQQQLRGPQAAKLTTLVKFPLTGFDMTPHLARDPNAEIASNEPEDNWSPWRRTTKRNTSHSFLHQNQHQLPVQLKDNRYDLYAVCYHQGDTLETGHYTAACKNPYDHQWYKFDDQRVSLVPSEQIQDDIVNNEAYILFYQRRPIDGSECSGTSSSSGADHWVSRIAAAPLGGATVPNENKPKDDPPKTESAVSVEIVSAECVAPKKIDDEIAPTKHSEDESDFSGRDKCTEQNGSDQQVAESNEKVVTVEIEVVKTPESVKESPEPLSTIPSITEAHSTTNVSEESSSKISPTTSEEPAQKETHNRPVEETDHFELCEEPKSSSVSSSRFSLPTSHSHFQDILWRDGAASAVSELLHHRPSSFTYKPTYESDAVSMIRGANTCSKDTLLFIDQQSHATGLDRVVLDDDDDEDLIGSGRALWISPVTPHKLITVSPKN
ncbi:ubiquitin carboxyl-terminal hydrolase 31 [Uranotaenia lowii]|uniref:ubiquitin carboxyl-terminal hydrolase 31 n=1 Tax=Uranotaenia lowii TaxID=190385 RepID=UPI00247922EC|nr:ubiquitin carboxyl-terminal hydrolase 31 [Uranotaenia lowii]